MKIKVSVPATSANIGSGFDALGLAVTLYNTVTFEDSEVLDISVMRTVPASPGASRISCTARPRVCSKKWASRSRPSRSPRRTPSPWHAVWALLRPASSQVCWAPTGCWAMCSTRRSCSRWPPAIEGHPDNVAPALLGGLTSSVFEDGKVYSVKRNVDETSLLCRHRAGLQAADRSGPRCPAQGGIP